MEVESFKWMNTEREYQIIVELKDDHEQNAKYPNLNTDSYLIHLPNPKWSDIQKFIWKGIEHFKELSGNIGFRQKKTRDTETISTYPQTPNLIGTIQEYHKLFFKLSIYLRLLSSGLTQRLN